MIRINLLAEKSKPQPSRFTLDDPPDAMRRALDASGSEIITVAVRRREAMAVIVG